MPPKSSEIFTPEELGTIGAIKGNALRDPELSRILQNIIDIFTKIRYKVAEVENNGTRKNISIIIDHSNQSIRLHEKITKIRGGFMSIVASLSKLKNSNSHDLVLSTRGFNYKKDSEPSINKHPERDREECLRLLKYFHRNLQEIVKQLS